VLEFGPDQGLQGQVVDIVRMLLDPDSMDQSPEKDPFLELFYDKYVGELINLLIEGAEQNQQQSQEQLDAFRRQEQVFVAWDLAVTFVLTWHDHHAAPNAIRNKQAVFVGCRQRGGRKAGTQDEPAAATDMQQQRINCEMDVAATLAECLS